MKSKAVLLLLLIRCLLLPHCWCGFCVWCLFCYVLLSVLSSFELYHLDREERAGSFTFVVFLIYHDCKCYVALPRGAVGWSAVFDCGIS